MTSLAVTITAAPASTSDGICTGQQSCLLNIRCYRGISVAGFEYSNAYSGNSTLQGLSQSSPSRYATEQLLRADVSSHIRGSQMQSQPMRSIAALKGTATDAQRAISDSMKSKLKPYANFDVFERYSHLCARNVSARYPPNLPQIASCYFVATPV
ncbi:hypothetical protein Tco_0080028 [Tanacetum coccineum]